MTQELISNDNTFDCPEMAVNYRWMRDDQTKNLPEGERFLDEAATAAFEKTGKYRIFKDWLIANGAIFDEDIEYPAVFSTGLHGLAAKKPIGSNKEFLFVPNTIIFSAERVKNCPEFH